VADELVFGDPKAPRFVFWEKKLRATPSGPDALTFDLLSIWGKLRAGLGAVGIANGQMPGGKSERVGWGKGEWVAAGAEGEERGFG
jgi:oxygen-dependent protoporphyrinogen oxidase